MKTSFEIHEPGLNVLPPGVERHVVNGGGLTGLQIFPEDEIEIIVRNNPDAMNINTFNTYQVLSPNGKLIPMSEIANMRKSQSFSTIKRNNGYREISVTGEINEILVNPDDIMKEIKVNILEKLQNDFNVILLVVRVESMGMSICTSLNKL